MRKHEDQLSRIFATLDDLALGARGVPTSRRFSPELRTLDTTPRQASNRCAVCNRVMSSIDTTNALAVTGPTPGAVARRVTRAAPRWITRRDRRDASVRGLDLFVERGTHRNLRGQLRRQGRREVELGDPGWHPRTRTGGDT